MCYHDGMVRTQVQLTEQQLKALRELSAQTGNSVADLIRRCVEQYLSARQHLDRNSQIERALRIVGRFRSGASDVSAEHDRYLAKAFHE